RRDVPLAQARTFRFLMPFLEGVAKAALDCAHRTSTFLSCAFCEQGGHLAAPPPPLLRPRVARAQKTIRLHPLPLLSRHGPIVHTEPPMNRYSASPCETLAERYQALLEVSQAISTHRDIDELFRNLAQRLPRVVHVNFVALSLHDPARNTMRLHTIQANVPADLVGGHEGPVEESPAGSVWQTQLPILVPDLAEERRWPKVTGHMKEDGVNSFCFVPLTTAVRRLGAMGFLSLQKEAYGETDLEFLQQVGNQVAVAVDN